MNNKYNYIEWRLEFLVLQHQTISNSIFNEKLIFKPTLLVDATLDQIEYFVNDEIWFRTHISRFQAYMKMPALINWKDTCYYTLLKLPTLDMVR